MQMLVDMVNKENISSSVNLLGWVEHKHIQDVMCQSQVLAFPSIREFGGGVVLAERSAIVVTEGGTVTAGEFTLVVEYID